MRKFYFYTLLSLLFLNVGAPEEVVAQTPDAELKALEQKLEKKRQDMLALETRVEELRLKTIRYRLQQMGWPSDETPIIHSAMALSYAEEHEQARWVAHIILPEIEEGVATRTNDFRTDPKVPTGSAEESDYFLTYPNDDSTFTYDSFGYDRGHLAPSADFRWNRKALSESYFYSNMSPQKPEFNRESWARLEALLREYVTSKQTMIYVVTGPILTPDLRKIERSVNGVSIPKQYFKVAYDPTNRRAVGFLMPNRAINQALRSFATSVDSIEQITGLNFFRNLDDDLEEETEATSDVDSWLPEELRDQVPPLDARKLSGNRLNTFEANIKLMDGDRAEVCGTVVSTYRSDKGNIFINLDRKFPNQVFSVSIWSRNVTNFSYQPHEMLKNQIICTKGKVSYYNETLSMNISNESQIDLITNEFNE